MTEYFIGLMSGTSLDGVDGVLVEFSGEKQHVARHVACEFAPELRAELLSLNTSGVDELHRASLAANALARTYARVVHQLLDEAGRTAQEVCAIGAHGQTVRHRPQEFDGTGYTLQINAPALLAELTGIDVVADFRSRDVAAGGQGAPLVPAFHLGVFGQAEAAVAVLNIGGIANVSLIGPTGSGDARVTGFDCGPGNVLLDYWCHRHTGRAYDSGGAWAATGHVHAHLLQALLRDPYFSKAPPKSTGRDLFHAGWLEHQLAPFPDVPAVDVQATLTALTAQSSAQAIRDHAPDSRCLLVCGGGALNDRLMSELAIRLPGVDVRSTTTAGLPPLQVEAAAFAWLARQTMQRETSNLPAVTGARGTRILGAIYPSGPMAGQSR